jgi:hypothetical protein
MAGKIAMPPIKYVDAAEYIETHAAVELDAQITKVTQEKDLCQRESHVVAQTYLALERRNNGILEELQLEKAENEKILEDKIALFQRTQKECQAEIHRVQVEIKKDFQAAEQVLIGHKKERNHLRFNIQEKKETEETRVSMLALRDKLTQELKDVTKELRAKYDAFEREQFALRNAQREAEQIKLKQMISEAKGQIDREKIDTLREAEAASKVLATQVTKSQKVVVGLRDQYNKLMEEANDLEMQLMEAKLVTQLTKPESKQELIAKLTEEKARLEDEKIRTRTKPEVENRRKTTQHANAMRKMRNELDGFMKLNALKHDEMEQLRALAMNVIDQRNALILFMNETMAALRHEIASTYDQRGRPFRTSELILCHLSEGDSDVLGRQFAANDAAQGMTASDQLKLLEVLYARFNGVPQPRKVEEAL